MVDDQPARVEVHLAADRAGQERVLRRRICRRRRSDGRSPPCGRAAGGCGRSAAAARPRRRGCRRGRSPGSGCAPAGPLVLVDMHLLAAGARLLGERQRRSCRPSIVGHADDQRPVDLARRAAGEALGEERRAARACGRRAGRPTCPCRAGGRASGAARPRRRRPSSRPSTMVVGPVPPWVARPGGLLSTIAARSCVDHHRLGELRSRPSVSSRALGLGAAPAISPPGGTRMHLAGVEPVAGRRRACRRRGAARCAPSARRWRSRPRGRWRLNQRSRRTPSSSSVTVNWRTCSAASRRM